MKTKMRTGVRSAGSLAWAEWPSRSNERPRHGELTSYRATAERTSRSFDLAIPSNETADSRFRGKSSTDRARWSRRFVKTSDE